MFYTRGFLCSKFCNRTYSGNWRKTRQTVT